MSERDGCFILAVLQVNNWSVSDLIPAAVSEEFSLDCYCAVYLPIVIAS